MSRSSEQSRANVVIWLFLVTAFLTPLSYYTLRSDPYDERFAWRMFSAWGFVDCEPKWTVGNPGREVPIYQMFHMAWVACARKGVGVATDAMTERLCQATDGQPVRLRMDCVHLDGTTDVRFDGQENLCLREP